MQQSETVIEPAIAAESPQVAAIAVESPQLATQDKRTFSKLVRNLSFYRALGLISGIIIGALLLYYDLDFLNTFSALGNTTSFFPWAWNEYYTTSGPVQSLYSTGFELSFSIMAGCATALFFVIMSLRKSLSPKESI
jgi:hypothetical protein